MKEKYKKIEKPSKPLVNLGETKFIRFKLPEYLMNLRPYVIKYIGPKRIDRMSKILRY